MTCECGRPTNYGNQCRLCYENRIRREVRDGNYMFTSAMRFIMVHNGRKPRKYNGYDKPANDHR